MTKREHTQGETVTNPDVLILGPDGVCQGIQIEVDFIGGDDLEESVPMKRQRSECSSPCSTVASTPVMTATSPEARAKALTSSFAELSVRQLKDQITELGGNFTGMAEKTELIKYLEMLHEPPPFQL
mmetsp:Transcript_49959/g.99186  ORF Transcript_49959/g.99186 Transcript_49959/m.99186 type:complete len:127 (+) Transcript_49959:82-462(+)|eukprot:CAMPEP_0172669566 /NCGR_PEP_ID=MMETSP1074-20121228/9764_1 /TAXON_ID=2916 /ORGANISM="Ceratium fusus, Strain PA161109" /LENGTH=126 /DNA_ID=CAMNT_0013486363 /DNA_START=74 /DNA_END=454 /DNA_ORIENTATION=-